MKKNIHPNYKTLLVKFPDGESFETRSTYKGDYIQLDIRPEAHPAWNKNKGAFLNKKAGKVASFAKKFGSLGMKGE
jgi:large subunit ribosomal protein L31